MGIGDEDCGLYAVGSGQGRLGSVAMSNEGRMGMKIVCSMQLAVSGKIGECSDARRMGNGDEDCGLYAVGGGPGRLGRGAMSDEG